MREVVEAAHAKGGAPPDSSFWGIAPDAFGDGANPPTFVIDVRDWAVAQARRAALPSHADGPEQPDGLDRRGRGAALARRRAVPPRAARRHRRSDARASRRNHPCRLRRSTSCAARTAADGSRWSTRCSTAAPRDEIHDGILGCHCCIFPLVDGIPVLHVLPASTVARDHLQAGRPELARRAMFGLDDDAQAEAFDAVASSDTRDLPGHRRGARTELRGRLFSLSLLRSDLHRRAGGGARGRAATVLGRPRGARSTSAADRDT